MRTQIELMEAIQKRGDEIGARANGGDESAMQVIEAYDIFQKNPTDNASFGALNTAFDMYLYVASFKTDGMLFK